MVRITLDKPYIPIPVPVTAIKYGLLYNWYAATDARNIAANGWSICAFDDIVILGLYCDPYGSFEYHLEQLMSVGEWSYETTNEYNFNAVPCYGRRADGTFILDEETFDVMYLMASNTSITLYIRADDLSAFSDMPGSGGSLEVNKKSGQSLRCVRLATEAEQLLSDGTACNNYTGNDGKVYRTVKIGTQVWLADNLAETKYRNGDTIPEVTDNAAWAALTTGALCAYNNDWSNVLID